MSWVQSLRRSEQVGLYVTHLLNRCKIRPNGAELRPWIVEELVKIEPAPMKVEVDAILYSMYLEGIRFEGQSDSGELFGAEPMFAGSTLGVPAGNTRSDES